jgi:hypothetical protein
MCFESWQDWLGLSLLFLKTFKQISDKYVDKAMRLFPLFLFNNMPIVSLDTVILKIAASLNKPQELNEGWRRIREDSNSLQIQPLNKQFFLSREVQSFLLSSLRTKKKTLSVFIVLFGRLNKASRVYQYKGLSVWLLAWDVLSSHPNDDFDYSVAPFRKMMFGFIGPVGRR